AENDWRAPHVVALEERGGAAGEEILRRFLAAAAA
ncbi:HAD family hydrolase, partial [Streptomyces sp. SID8455]|nr:HAD family hydrolase [Streptomyces sp. SID8455]